MILSIIICSYNRASYISDALTSLYNQSSELDNFEVIIVDNNSTDNTKEVYVIWRQTNTNGQFTFISETKQGASFARNTGATIAKGEWVCFMDDDAVATPNYVENILKHIQNKHGCSRFWWTNHSKIYSIRTQMDELLRFLACRQF